MIEEEYAKLAAIRGAIQSLPEPRPITPDVIGDLPVFTVPLSVDLNLKSVEIDSETADNIVVASMIDQYYDLKKEIEWLKTIETPLKYQKEDLEDNEKLLDAVVAIIKHYAAHTKWPEELKNG